MCIYITESRIRSSRPCRVEETLSLYKTLLFSLSQDVFFSPLCTLPQKKCGAGCPGQALQSFTSMAPNTRSGQSIASLGSPAILGSPASLGSLDSISICPCHLCQQDGNDSRYLERIKVCLAHSYTAMRTGVVTTQATVGELAFWCQLLS